jgi:hypothetical protein
MKWSGLQYKIDKCNLSPSECTDVNIDWERWKDLFPEAAAEFIQHKAFKQCNSPPWVDGEVCVDPGYHIVSGRYSAGEHC